MESASPVVASPQTETTPEIESEVLTTSTGAFSPIFDKPSDNNNNGNKRPQPTLTPANILRLQRTIGNQAVQRMIKARSAQENKPTVPAQISRISVQVSRIPSQIQRDDTPQQAAPENNEESSYGTQIVQNTDLDVVDNYGDEQPLPIEVNELGSDESGNQMDDPYGGGGGGAVDDSNEGGPQGFQRPAPDTPSGDPKAVASYKATPLLNAEKDEDIGQGAGIRARQKGLIGDSAMPLRTRYLNREERRAYRISIEGGLFLDASGNRLDSSDVYNMNKQGGEGFIFVMSRRSKMYAADMVAEYQRGKYDSANKQIEPGATEVVGFHHSSFKGGKGVAGAGEIILNNGKLTKYTDASGHYQPKPEFTLQVMRAFRNQGVRLTEVRLKLFEISKFGIDDIYAEAFLQAEGDIQKSMSLDAEMTKNKAADKPANPSETGNMPGTPEADGKYRLTVAAYTSAPSIKSIIATIFKSKITGVHQDAPVGHTWVIFKDKTGKLTSYGFMPDEHKGFKELETDGFVKSPDDKHISHSPAMYDYELTMKEYLKAMQKAVATRDAPPKYGLLTYNCTSFAVDVVKAAGQAPPNASKLGVDSPNAMAAGIEDKNGVGLPEV